MYAVAGVGELAYRQLLRLPTVTAELREDLPTRMAELRAEFPARMAELRAELPNRVGQLRDELPNRVAELRSEIPARVQRLRFDLPAAMTTLVASTYRVYFGLVARGERAVAGARRGEQARPVMVAEVPAAARTKAVRPAKAIKASAKATKAAAKATRPPLRRPRAESR